MKKIAADVDIRKLPAAERPKPTSGQSREAFFLGWDATTVAEQKIIKALNEPGEGRRETHTVAAVAKVTRLTTLQVRNSLRRLVPSRWAERVGSTIDDDGNEVATRGRYRITESGRKRLATASN